MVQLFGSTISETANAFKTLHFGENQPSANKDDRVKAIGRIVVSILLVFLAAYLFATNKDTIAGTIVGALTGYWIR